MHLVFKVMWRDFRGLRDIAQKSGLASRDVTFQFVQPLGGQMIPGHLVEFFNAQTMAAIRGFEHPGGYGEIDQDFRVLPVRYSCRGSNYKQ